MSLIVLGVVAFFIKRRGQGGGTQPIPLPPQIRALEEQSVWAVHDSTGANPPYNPYHVNSPLLSFRVGGQPSMMLCFSRILRIQRFPTSGERRTKFVGFHEPVWTRDQSSTFHGLGVAVRGAAADRTISQRKAPSCASFLFGSPAFL